jgi:hypothetical protein
MTGKAGRGVRAKGWLLGRAFFVYVRHAVKERARERRKVLGSLKHARGVFLKWKE